MAATFRYTLSTPRIALTLVLTALASLAAFGQPAQAEVRPVPALRYAVAELEPAVVSILAYHKDGSASQGTGFLVRADGLVVTSDHVVRGARTMEITWSSRLDRPAETATLVKSDRNL
ncbi:MAG TPA: hypothetical protein VEI97_18040, partial [bacterium]|nr:hypothetical protein [bacterium]